VPVPAYLPDTPVVRRDIAQHDDNTAEVDRLVGQRLEALEASGLAQNTVVIFIVDHGRGLPREKRWPYPAGLHMPLIIRWPGKIGPGTVEHRLVSWVDLAPTILRIAGVEVPKHYDGLAFLGPGGVSVQPEREHAFGGRDRMDEALDRQRVCTDGRYWYVRNFFPQLPYAQRVRYMENGPTTQELRRLHAAGELHGSAEVFMQPTKPAEEFYDLAGDPDAVSNLVDDPAHEGTLQRLRLAMDDWLEGDWDLGAVPERELIQRGLQEDQLDQYRSRIEPLPPAQQIGPELTVLEPHEVPDRPSGT
jgi:arylsulfatase A-like enzyme